MSTLKQRAILAAQIKRRNDEQEERQEREKFLAFCCQQMTTALTDIGVEHDELVVLRPDGCVTEIMHDEDGLTLTARFMRHKFSTRPGVVSSDDHMCGTNPLAQVVVSLPCAVCGNPTYAGEIDLLANDALAQLGLTIERDALCSADCEMRANGHEQFISTAVA